MGHLEVTSRRKGVSEEYAKGFRNTRCVIDRRKEAANLSLSWIRFAIEAEDVVCEETATDKHFLPSSTGP